MWFREIVSDGRLAVRGLRRAPGYSAVVVVTLGVGIAAVTTIFSFVNSALLRDPPYRDAHRLVSLTEDREHAYEAFSAASGEAIARIRAQAHSFDRIGTYQVRPVEVAADRREMRVMAAAVDTATLPLLGVEPMRGRLFSAEEMRSRTPAALVSDVLARRLFASADTALGRVVHIDGALYQVVGVMPASFGFPDRELVWIPLNPSLGSTGGVARDLSVVAHLRPSARRQSAAAELADIAAQLARDDSVRFHGERLVMRDGLVDRGTGAVPSIAVVFLVAALIVLLVAGANIGNLAVVRATERRAQTAVRVALGASSWQLVRLQLSESLVLCSIASTLGVIVSAWGIQLLTSMVPLDSMPTWVHIGLDARVLGAATGLALVMTVLVAIPPARYARRLDVNGLLKQGAEHGAVDADGLRSARLAAATEMALSMVLVLGAALLAETYWRLAAVDAGYQAERVLDTRVEWDPASAPSAIRQADVGREVAAAVGRAPGAAAAAIRGAFEGWRDSLASSSSLVSRESPGVEFVPRDRGLYLPDSGAQPADRDLRPRATTYVVSNDYFRTLGIATRRGRTFDPNADRASGALVAVVSERLARGLWHTSDVTGRLLRIGRDGAPVLVVGVTADISEPRDTRGSMTVEPIPLLYLSADQAALSQLEILVRGGSGAAAAVRRALASADPGAHIVDVERLSERQRRAMRPIRTVAGVMIGFAVCALALAIIGIYGVVAYAVARRTREIGIRMALGGTAPDVLWLVMRQNVGALSIGLGAGALASIALNLLAAHILAGLTAFQPVTYGLVITAFAILAVAASYVPARRATRVDPLTALRAE